MPSVNSTAGQNKSDLVAGEGFEPGFVAARSGMIRTVPYKDPADQAKAARAHYLANKQQYTERAQRHRLATRAKIKEAIREAKNKPCTDCGVLYPFYVMQFDHLGDKNFSLGAFSTHTISLKRVQEEIEKCEVVCANCHAVRTWQRGQDESDLVAGGGFEPPTSGL